MPYTNSDIVLHSPCTPAAYRAVVAVARCEGWGLRSQKKD